MSTRPAWPAGATLALLLAACGSEHPAGPAPLNDARGGIPGSNAAPLTAAPSSLEFVLPSSTTSGTVTASVQFVGNITSSTSDAACATVSPLSLPATKPAGSSVYVATFTITAVGFIRASVCAFMSCRVSLFSEQASTRQSAARRTS